jgi:hypothetical protein
MNVVGEIESVKESFPYLIIKYKSGSVDYVDCNDKNRGLLSQYLD